MINILKNIALISVVLALLEILGIAINIYLPWEALTLFFTILRYVSNIFAFTWDMGTLWIIVGAVFMIRISIYAFRSGLTAINYFKNN